MRFQFALVSSSVGFCPPPYFFQIVYLLATFNSDKKISICLKLLILLLVLNFHLLHLLIKYIYYFQALSIGSMGSGWSLIKVPQSQKTQSIHFLLLEMKHLFILLPKKIEHTVGITIILNIIALGVIITKLNL